ncbi:MAG: helical backbone metal receptor [Dermatophilaceae bacterium]
MPSLTEAIAASAPGVLVGATEWCTHPPGLDVVRVRGTKNPHLERIVTLRPDLVVANEEENRKRDVEALRGHGIPVWVTDVRSVNGALASLGRLLDLLEAPERGWLEAARRAWSAPVRTPAYRAVVPIWRRPWMFLGSGTYAGDVLRRLGVTNVLGGHPQRYPRCELDELPAYDLVVLPDEPYRFSSDDGPEAFPGMPCALVDGRSLTWYGPAMVSAPSVLGAALTAARF